jgi:[calcium/calmodulin-dependent protein kinase] kinase
MFEIIEAEEHDYLYIILELADYGQLAKWDFHKEVYVRNEKVISCVTQALERNGQLVPEEELPLIEQVARYIFYKLAMALIYLHEEARIIHRDIKLDNILFDSQESEVKLSDFTVSHQEVSDQTRLFDCEGTPSFTAPECTIVEKEGYLAKPTDIWSYGVCVYTYVAGIVPFYGDCELQIQINTRNKDLTIPEEFSDELKDLVQWVLNKDPSQRPTAREVIEHPWFVVKINEPEEEQQSETEKENQSGPPKQ